MQCKVKMPCNDRVKYEMRHTARAVYVYTQDYAYKQKLLHQYIPVILGGPGDGPGSL